MHASRDPNTARLRPSGRAEKLFPRVRAALAALTRELTTEASLASLVVTLVLVTRVELGSPRGQKLLAPAWTFLAQHLPLLAEPLFQRQVLAILLQILVPLGVIGLVHRRVHGESFRAYGLGAGDLRFWMPLAVLVFVGQVLVVWLYLSKDPAYVHRYPSLAAARHGGPVFWTWEASRVFYMISWEFLFRGYLLYALARRAGHAALILQTVPFVLMHIVSAKPPSEVYFTILSGLLSGLFVLEAESIWPVVFLHAAGAVCLDVFLVFG